MDEKLTRTINSRYQILGIYQLVGGIVGYAVLFLVIATIEMATIASLILLILAVFLYGYSTYCGAMLLRRRKTGIQHSLINQYLQLISIGIGGYAYKFAAGMYIFVGYDKLRAFVTDVGLSTYTLNFATDEKFFFIEFNFMALIIIIQLFRLQKKVEEKETRIKIEQLGS